MEFVSPIVVVLADWRSRIFESKIMSDRKWVGEPMEGEYNFQRTNNRLTNGLTEGNACVSRRIRRPILESHDTRDRCQSVDFRHAFLELRPDRIREVAARTRGCAHASILAYTVAESRKSFLQIRRKA